MLQANQISKSFGNRRVLRKLDLTLQRGEVVALVGLNGTGKSTLIRTLCGLNRPESGKVTIDGIPLTGAGAELRHNLGVVLHASMLYNNLTCLENLEFYSRLFNVPSPRERIFELLDLMDLTSRAQERVSTLSRGMQQRLSVARAILHDPTFLLYDEVFSGLDQRFLSRIAELIKQQASSGKGILFSTHDLEKVFITATRVDILHNGSIVFSGLVKELSPRTLLDTFDELTNTFRHDQVRSKGVE